MEHSNAIWNANLELQRQVKNKIERIFLHYLKRFVTTEKKIKNKDDKWCILTASVIRYGTSENILKTRTLNNAFWRHSELFGNAEKTNENNDDKWCILTVSDTIWNFREHFENTWTLDGAFLRHLSYDMELQRTFWKHMDAKWCILTAFETIWNCRDHFDTTTLSCALLWHILTIFETAVRRNSTYFKRAWSNPGFFENKDRDWCIRMLFETKILKCEKI